MKGRCAGCGETGPVREIRAHCRSCPEYAKLYRSDPKRALPAGLEYERWLEQDRDSERAREIKAAIAVVDGYRAAQAERFRRPPDILGEEQ